MKSLEEHKAELDDLRSDPRLTVQRYDEIIALRMLLLDFLEIRCSDPYYKVLSDELIARSSTWGKKGDCV